MAIVQLLARSIAAATKCLPEVFITGVVERCKAEYTHGTSVSDNQTRIKSAEKSTVPQTPQKIRGKRKKIHKKCKDSSSSTLSHCKRSIIVEHQSSFSFILGFLS
jgi:hypothetical protein